MVLDPDRRLPNVEDATLDARRLTTYLLNSEHPAGRHKARVFMSALGIGTDHASDLSRQVMAAILTAPAFPAFPGILDEHGQRYSVDVLVTGPRRGGMVKTGWIIRSRGGAPEFLSAYLLPRQT